MPNMSYCRFQNTVGDMRDCTDWLDEEMEHDPEKIVAKLSADELTALKEMLEVAQELTSALSLEDIENAEEEAEHEGDEDA